MIVIGIVGGIASGKSFVTSHLESLGAVVLDADRIGHAVLATDQVIDAIRDQWGDKVISRNGTVDRSALAAIVFDPEQPGQLEKLEEITHPLIAERLRAEINRLAKQGETAFLVLDAPVMVKAGWHVFCDVIIFVDASLAERRRRAAQRGWSSDMLANREAMQAAVEDKRKLGSYLVDNNGSREQTVQQVNEIWSKIRETGSAIN